MLSLFLLGSLFVTAAPNGFAPLAARTQSALSRCETWMAERQDLAFDVRIYSVADEAMPEVRFATGFPDHLDGEHVLQPPRTATVEELLAHIIQAGHAREEIKTTLFSSWGTKAVAVREREFTIQQSDPDGGVTTTPRHRAARVLIHSRTPRLTRTELYVELQMGAGEKDHARPDDLTTSSFMSLFHLNPGESFLDIAPDPLQQS